MRPASRLREADADAAIGADVMTGFPGETDAEFEETVALSMSNRSRTCTCSRIRSGRNAAAERGDPVPMSVRHERTRILRALSERKNLEFRQRLIGKTLSAVTLEQRGIALTTNFVKVQMSQPRAPNQIADLPIAALSDIGLQERTPFPVLQ